MRAERMHLPRARAEGRLISHSMKSAQSHKTVIPTDRSEAKGAEEPAVAFPSISVTIPLLAASNIRVLIQH